MKIIQLKTNPQKYSSNSYLVLGSWNKIEDINSLVDTGVDDFIQYELETVHKGFGKKVLDQILLTHSHFDHSGGVEVLKQKFDCEVFSFTRINGTDRKLFNEDIIKMGDEEFRVLHTPGHSTDSICLYNKTERVLFSGDTNIDIKGPGSFTTEFIESLELLERLSIKVIYPGHGEIINDNVQKIIRNSLKIVEESLIYNYKER